MVMSPPLKAHAFHRANFWRLRFLLHTERECKDCFSFPVDGAFTVLLKSNSINRCHAFFATAKDVSSDSGEKRKRIAGLVGGRSPTVLLGPGYFIDFLWPFCIDREVSCWSTLFLSLGKLGFYNWFQPKLNLWDLIWSFESNVKLFLSIGKYFYQKCQIF